MKVAITGSSGLIGTALKASLRVDGHDVLALVRRPASGPDEATWDPQGGTIDVDRMAGVDAVVNLAGAGIGDHRWTASYKREILDSRVLGTGTLVRGILELDPRPRVLVSGSAIGWYGDTGSQAVDETGPPGTGFVAEVAQAWELAADPAREAGVRVTHPRTGLVVAGNGGAWGRPLLPLPGLFPLFRLGVGGRLGPGTQYWSFVSLRDTVAAMRRMIDDDQLAGPYNVTAPDPVTNATITSAMGKVMHRPTLLPVPAFALRAVLGELSNEVLASIRVVPTRLTEAGFTFADPTIDDALRAALGQPDS
jgi:uncharacterized protein (TIGR01777 family)